MDGREGRSAANELLARRINELIEAEQPRNGNSGDRFVCECSRADCAEPIDISPAEYTRVRAQPRRFIVRDGHQDPDIEAVVADLTRFIVVEKFADPEELARHDRPS